MGIDETDALAHQLMPLDKETQLLQGHGRSDGKGSKKRQNLVSIFDLATGQFTDNKGMTEDLSIQK